MEIGLTRLQMPLHMSNSSERLRTPIIRTPMRHDLIPVCLGLVAVAGRLIPVKLIVRVFIFRMRMGVEGTGVDRHDP